MSLSVNPPLAPMEATPADEIPKGLGWQYEPKWDGLRCLAFRDGRSAYLQSKRLQPLAGSFPEVAAAIRKLDQDRFVLDGEIAVPIEGRFSYDALELRLQPSSGRVARLGAEHPALYIVFDLLCDGSGRSLLHAGLRDRRRALEAFAARQFDPRGPVRLSPASPSLDVARRWLGRTGPTIDGIVAKRLDLGYRPGERDGMVKVKTRRTADCVVGGFRFAAGGRSVASLLLGLYDGEGLLRQVGFTSALRGKEREELSKELAGLRDGPGFNGRAPGGSGRRSRNRGAPWEPVRPRLVVEVRYDRFCRGHFRHGTGFLRRRPDKEPRSCTFDQVVQRTGGGLRLLERSSARRQRTG